MVSKTDNYKYFGYQIQLIDFGFARTFQDSQNDQMVMGSPHYVAPESLMQHYSYASDAWSIGIMLYYVISLEYPFEDSVTTELFRKIKEDSLQFEPRDAWEDISENFKDLIGKMLEKDPEKRIKIEDILIHPVFKEIHEVEAKVSFDKESKEKLKWYFTRLNSLERKFLKYSTKFSAPTAKTTYWEKFIFLDKDNLGYVNFKVNIKENDYISEASESSEGSEDSEEKDSGSNSENEGKSTENEGKGTENMHKVTYSDYLAAILDPNVLCGGINIELLFHTLNPSHLTEWIMKEELKDALFFGNEDEETKLLFSKLKWKIRGGKEIMSKDWITEYYDKIFHKLNGDESNSDSKDED